MTAHRGSSGAVLDASLQPALTSRANRHILRSLPSAQTLLLRSRTTTRSGSGNSGSGNSSRGSSNTTLPHRPDPGGPKNAHEGEAGEARSDAEAGGTVDFSSNDYLSLSSSLDLRARFLDRLQASPNILGAGGSRLLDGGTLEHALLEERLCAFFDAPAALLYTSGYDANVGLFACVPRAHDVVLYDELIHASVHDGLRASRASASTAFAHNDVHALGGLLARLVEEREDIRAGTANVFVAVESLYSMDGDIAPLVAICDAVENLLPNHNGHVIVDEAHATGVYGPGARGLVALFGLEDRVAVRLHTFGKALAGSGAVLLTSPTVRSFLLNYSRPQIFTTSMTHANVIAIHSVIDTLEDGSYHPLAIHLLELCSSFATLFNSYSFPPSLVRLPAHLTAPPSTTTPLPTPIIPLLTPQARPLSAFLQSRGFVVRPITHPTVPKGRDRVRVCLHARNTLPEVNRFLGCIQDWVRSQERPELVRQARL